MAPHRRLPRDHRLNQTLRPGPTRVACRRANAEGRARAPTRCGGTPAQLLDILEQHLRPHSRAALRCAPLRIDDFDLHALAVSRSRPPARRPSRGIPRTPAAFRLTTIWSVKRDALLRPRRQGQTRRGAVCVEGDELGRLCAQFRPGVRLCHPHAFSQWREFTILAILLIFIASVNAGRPRQRQRLPDAPSASLCGMKRSFTPTTRSRRRLWCCATE